MRIRIIAEPRNHCIDGVQLDGFHVGQEYDVGPSLGAVFLCEGWAEQVDDQTPPRLIPPRKSKRVAAFDEPVPPNLVRDTSPPSYEGRAIAMDRSRRRRRKSR
jgi:hypothetical protein